ncbi:hypothetical protein [Rivularia sp. UHCC 0363]|uniref:hypothetical protein n=1 Tax=Rivularia sp. UHCC 0363 TaxID=3110244 RepID=UPI002B210B04|nr:hypothetical protein [Rivularia sp. UHCC 0363]MEA5595666.1 hypothetical protein [Rivularia sp. UHCC 0363]
MKRSHVENIRKAVKKVGDYKPTAEQIRTAILKVCPDGEVNQNKQSIVEEVISLIESSSQIQTSKELVEVDDRHELESSNNSDIPEETTLTVAQQRKLVASVASQLEVTLSESEIVQVSQSLNNQIETRSEFIAEISSAIRSFIDTKANSQKQEINNFVEDTIDYAASKFNDNDRRLKEGLQEINNFFRSDSARIKQLSKSIAIAFK